MAVNAGARGVMGKRSLPSDDLRCLAKNKTRLEGSSEIKRCINKKAPMSNYCLKHQDIRPFGSLVPPEEDGLTWEEVMAGAGEDPHAVGGGRKKPAPVHQCMAMIYRPGCGTVRCSFSKMWKWTPRKEQDFCKKHIDNQPRGIIEDPDSQINLPGWQKDLLGPDPADVPPGGQDVMSILGGEPADLPPDEVEELDEQGKMDEQAFLDHMYDHLDLESVLKADILVVEDSPPEKGLTKKTKKTKKFPMVKAKKDQDDVWIPPVPKQKAMEAHVRFWSRFRRGSKINIKEKVVRCMATARAKRAEVLARKKVKPGKWSPVKANDGTKKGWRKFVAVLFPVLKLSFYHIACALPFLNMSLVYDSMTMYFSNHHSCLTIRLGPLMVAM